MVSPAVPVMSPGSSLFWTMTPKSWVWLLDNGDTSFKATKLLLSVKLEMNKVVPKQRNRARLLDG